MNINLKDAEFLIKTVRSAISDYLEKNEILKPKNYDKKFSEKCGVFVTLKSYPSDELRGCIGIPLPVKPLIEAIIDSAIDSATADPRFEPIKLNELKNIVIEITILTQPDLISVKSPEEYPDKIEIGTHGLIVELGFNKGLLLPQVPVEWNWNNEEFLNHTCMKAGLPEDAWLNSKNIKIYKFSGKIFAETSPSGKIIEKKLTE